MTAHDPEQASPWRPLFEEVRKAAANRRDEHGVRGSINWLRRQMELRGGNPNVVRNIVYRDKGKLADKRVLFDVLRALWEESTGEGLRCPEIEVLLSRAGEAETDVVRLLGREKRRAYGFFVGAVRGGEYPKMLVTGRPGSGKTLLIDYVQEALEADPPAPVRTVRAEFGAGRLETSLVRLATAVGVPAELIEAKIMKIGASGAYSVQADAQAEVARLIVEALRATDEPLVLLTHVSRSTAAVESLGETPLRLHTPEVPRVNGAEWLWLALFGPLSRLPRLAMLVSMSDLPARASSALGSFEEPLRLSPPTINEARRFVRARLPHLPTKEQEEVVRRSGRSYEELRTLTLLTEVKAPLASGGSPEEERRRNFDQLATLVTSAGEARLREFLTALAVLSLPEFPTFELPALQAVRGGDEVSALELAFIDPVPPDPERYRAFSRNFVHTVRETLLGQAPERLREFSARAADYYRTRAEAQPNGEVAGRYLQHLFWARDWERLTEWMGDSAERGLLIPQIWNAAQQELEPGAVLELVAYRVARHYVRLGAYEHPQARSAFAVLESSLDGELCSWALIQRAEGAVLRGQVEQAESFLDRSPAPGAKRFAAEIALVRASIARWRTRLDEAAVFVERVAKPRLSQIESNAAAGVAVHCKAAVWAGLIAKDRGDLEGALREFESVAAEDELIVARVAFQRGDVLLSLGRFDRSLSAFDQAVELARQSHALTSEQTRYLSRRATLHRLMGHDDAAERDFAAARAILETSEEEGAGIERRFWWARCEDERALLLLDRGHFEEALDIFEDNVRTFQNYGDHLGVDSSYRVLRGTLRLARTYLYRGLGTALRPPRLGPLSLPDDEADLNQARVLLASVMARLSDLGRNSWPLRREAFHLSSLLAGEPAAALAHADCALAEARSEHHVAQTRSFRALAYLRAGDAERSLAETELADELATTLHSPEEQGDPGLQATLAGLKVIGLMGLAEYDRAAAELSDWTRLAGSGPFTLGLIRLYGEAAESFPDRGEAALRALANAVDRPPARQDGRLRLPDALLQWWRTRGDEEPTERTAAAAD